MIAAYGFFKLGIPGILILVALAGIGFYRRRAAAPNGPALRASAVAVFLIGGAIALVDGYTIFGGGMIVLAVLVGLGLGFGPAARSRRNRA